jgi:hypothetical protein
MRGMTAPEEPDDVESLFVLTPRHHLRFGPVGAKIVAVVAVLATAALLVVVIWATPYGIAQDIGMSATAARWSAALGMLTGLILLAWFAALRRKD